MDVAETVVDKRGHDGDIACATIPGPVMEFLC